MTNTIKFRIIGLMSNFRECPRRLAIAVLKSGGVQYVKNLSAKKTPEKKRTWLQKKNENCFRQKNFIQQAQKGQKETVSVKKCKAESKKARALYFLPFLTFKTTLERGYKKDLNEKNNFFKTEPGL